MLFTNVSVAATPATVTVFAYIRLSPGGDADDAKATQAEPV